MSFVNYPDEMCDGLGRLKNLGLGLQSEIDNQDDSIDSLLNKVDKMDVKICNTNQQIKNLKWNKHLGLTLQRQKKVTGHPLTWLSIPASF